MFSDYKSYIKGEYYFDPSDWFAMGMAVMVIGGIIGFIYESVFYWANTGFNTFYWRSGSFGPWVDVYCIASLLLFIILYKMRRLPWLAFIVGTVLCTAVQLLVGLGLYYFCDGARAWNYNLEILNYGSIGGFICLRSAIEFAVLTILVMYVIAPAVYHMACSMRKAPFNTLWIILGLLCLIDIVYNDIVCIAMPSLTSAHDVYSNLGFKYMK